MITKERVRAAGLLLVLCLAFLFSGCRSVADGSRVLVNEAMEQAFESSGLLVGNPQNEWFVRTYGHVTSGIETFGEAQGCPSLAMRHDAWMHVGNSGGAVYNEKLELSGIVTGGVLAPDGQTFRYGVFIPGSEIRIFLDEEKERIPWVY